VGPQWGEKQVKGEVEGVDVMFGLDVSKSMMAEDMSTRSETRDRLTAAKVMIQDYVEKNSNNRYGLIVFAGDAFVSSPITFDKEAFITFLQATSYKDVGQQGTDIEKAIEMALARFATSDTEGRGKLFVLLSDGGDELSGDYQELVDQAKDLELKMVVVGIGDEKGVPIPDGKDMFGRNVYKMYQGEQVLTKLNDEALKKLAIATDGEYIHAKSPDDLNRVTEVIDKMEKSSMQRDGSAELENRYQLFAGSALALLIMVVSWPLIQGLKKT
jgi:Ca-activated chloride channel family protein